MGRPLQAVTPKKTLREATRRMRQEDVKKLVVLKGMNIVGGLTAQGVINSNPGLRPEISEYRPPARAS